MIQKSIASILCVLTLTAAAGDAEKDAIIRQKDREFSIKEITIKPGESVTFKNDDSVTHNVFSNSKVNPFTIKVQAPGQSSKIEFKDEGVTDVRCAIHPRMKLVVTVKK